MEMIGRFHGRKQRLVDFRGEKHVKMKKIGRF
jgi:hypothetical protein